MSELASKRNDLQGAWNRHILTIASGGLALLVGLKPEVPADTPGKWLLAAAWTFLGLGILSGGAATHAEVSMAKNLAKSLQSRLQKTLDAGLPISDFSKGGPLSANANWISRVACHVMIWSLLLAVISFVAYSVRQILTA
ncbi:MAG TPA: hypothetical protein PLA50_17470 [Bacteroidia bacterium]|nr:hypothetical protein [Bacteroidia bacterium]